MENYAKKSPIQSYILCTSPRSGSTLLCHLLTATGLCGVPDSHFHEPSLAAWMQAYGVDGPQDRASLRRVVDAAMAEGRGASGMFGLRVQRHSAAYLFRQLARLEPEAESDLDGITASFGRTAFLYLTRENKLDQAISYVKAEQTGLWHRAPDGREIERLSAPRAPVYDAAALRRQIDLFEQYEAEWLTWFAQERIAPLRLTYEMLAANPLGALAEALNWLGLDPACAEGWALPVAKLADATNAEWAERYRAESP